MPWSFAAPAAVTTPNQSPIAIPERCTRVFVPALPVAPVTPFQFTLNLPKRRPLRRTRDRLLPLGPPFEPRINGPSTTDRQTHPDLPGWPSFVNLRAAVTPVSAAGAPRTENRPLTSAPPTRMGTSLSRRRGDNPTNAGQRRYGRGARRCILESL